MTNLITLTIPNDDHIALRAFGKALEEMALAHGAEPRKTIGELSYDINAVVSGINPEITDAYMQGCYDTEAQLVETDTTTQQVESLAANVVDRTVDLPEPTVSDTTTDSTNTPWDERIHSASKALNADGTWRLRRKPKDMDEVEWAAFVESVKNELIGIDAQEQYDAVRNPMNINPVSIDPAPDETTEPPVTHQNPAYMYQESRNVYALGRSEEEIAEYETKGYVRHTQEQYDAWEGPNTTDEGDDHHTDAGVVTEQTVVGIPPLPVPPPVVVAPPVPEVTAWDFPRLMTFLTERHGKIDVATVNTLLAQDGMSSVQELNAHPDKIGPFVARVKAHLGE